MKKALFHLQYELDKPYTETGSDRGAKLVSEAITDDETRQLLDATAHMSYKQLVARLSQQPKSGNVVVLPITTSTPESTAYRLENTSPRIVFMLRPLHTIARLDDTLYALNNGIAEGTIVCCHTMTAVLKRKLTTERYPWGVAHILIGWNYVWHRICPKLQITHGLYYSLTGGKDRSMNRVEVLGRLYRAGFEVLDEKFRDGEFFVTARKTKPPVDDTEPTGSPIIHLRRIGKGGKEIVVHKFRTMYTYSEYIQDYVYQYQSLEHGGKFKDDYRVNFWGRILRRLWLDELPMVWNMLRGDLKLVGVRPLSHQYFNLYSREMQQLRIKTKPGLLPPFYYERQTPETLDEVQESERRYLEAYLKHPFATDWRYFWGIVANILFHRKHSS